MRSRIQVLFTFDLEDWYHANFSSTVAAPQHARGAHIVQQTHMILQHLETHGIKATFFVLGAVAVEHPNLVRSIWSAGHEIACHGFQHDLSYCQDQATFREDVHRAKALLEDITGQRVSGFRAPCWSITRSSWQTVQSSNAALQVLCDEGFVYDSSLFPFRTYLYGVANAPRFPHVVYLGSGQSIWEIPASTWSFWGKAIPFGGGFSFRILPFSLTMLLAMNCNMVGQPMVFYLHPREVDPATPRLLLGLRDRFVHYSGIRSCLRRFSALLKISTGVTMTRYVSNQSTDMTGNAVTHS